MKTGTYILAASLLAASLLALSLALMQWRGRAEDPRTLPQDYNDELVKRILHLGHLGREEAKIEREKIAQGLVSQGDEAIPTLEKYLGHRDWRVRYFAVTVLGHIKGVKSRNLLLRAVHQSQANAIQVAAMRALQGRPLERDDLVRLLTHENREVETMALESLENIEIDETLLSVLSKQLSGPDWRIRCQVARIVGRHKEIPANVKVALVLPALKEETRNSRGAALLPGSYVNESEFIKVQYHFSLEAMGEPAIPFLREAGLTAEGELAERISMVLGYLGDQSAYGPLVKILTDEENSGYVRSFAARSLGKLGNRNAIPTLVQALTDDFSVTYSTDVSVVRGEPPLRKIYPVRQAAAAALRALDIEVVREGSNFQVVR